MPRLESETESQFNGSGCVGVGVKCGNDGRRREKWVYWREGTLRSTASRIRLELQQIDQIREISSTRNPFSTASNHMGGVGLGFRAFASTVLNTRFVYCKFPETWSEGEKHNKGDFQHIDGAGGDDVVLKYKKNAKSG